MRNAILAALLAAGLALPARVHAQDSGPGLFSRLHYGVTAGGMIPVGQQGKDLRRGGHFGAEAYGETALGVQFGTEGSYTASTDPLKTRIAQVGVFTRLSPSPEDYRLYVQFGLGGYAVSYHPESPSLPRPSSAFRPGGSFAIGAEFAQLSALSIGGSACYHGILLQRHHAVAYSTLRLHVTYQHLAL